MADHVHSVCGLTLIAPCVVPGFRTAREATGDAIQLCIQSTPRTLVEEWEAAGREPDYVSPFSAPDGQPRLRMWRLPSSHHYMLLRPDGSRFWVDHRGRSVWMDWPIGTPFSSSNALTEGPVEFLRSFVLAFLLRLRGVLCLHAAVVVVNGRAIALAGRPGVGKSTIAAALARRGHAIVTDDVAAIHWNLGRPNVAPGPTVLQPRKPDQRATDTELLDIAALSGGQPQAPVPLAGLCVLRVSEQAVHPGQSADAAPSPAQAVVALLADTWASRLQTRFMRAHEFDATCRMVSAVKLTRIDRQTSAPATVSAIADLLERFADRCALSD